MSGMGIKATEAIFVQNHPSKRKVSVAMGIPRGEHRHSEVLVKWAVSKRVRSQQNTPLRVPEPETRRSRSVHGREAAALVLGLCLNASCHRYWSSGNALWAWEAPGNCKCSGSEDLSSAGWEAVQWHLRKHFWDGKLGDKMETSGSFILVKTRALPQIRPKGSHTKANPCSAWWNPAFFWGTIHIFPP